MRGNLLLTKSVGPNIKVLIGPLIVMVLIGSLFILVATKGYARVRTQIEEYNLTQQKENTLKEKLNSINKVDSQIIDSADATIVALPSKNPATLVLSQLKTSLNESASTIKEISSTLSSNKDSLKSMNISLELENPDLVSSTKLLENILGSAPVMNISDFRSQINEQEPKYLSNLEVTFYWASFPLNLPSITEPISQLSTSQLELLNKVSSLERPSFGTLNPTSPSERSSPFN